MKSDFFIKNLTFCVWNMLALYFLIKKIIHKNIHTMQKSHWLQSPKSLRQSSATFSWWTPSGICWACYWMKSKGHRWVLRRFPCWCRWEARNIQRAKLRTDPSWTNHDMWSFQGHGKLTEQGWAWTSWQSKRKAFSRSATGSRKTRLLLSWIEVRQWEPKENHKQN